MSQGDTYFATFALNDQNGASSRPLDPRRRLRIFQISRAKSDRLSGGVAWIIATASATGILPPGSPFIDITAFIHAPRFSAPADLAGLYWCVLRPSPTRRNVFPHRTLQLRHVQMRLTSAVFSSWPSRWPTSTLRLDPQNAQILSPGGGQTFARYRSALSVI